MTILIKQGMERMPKYQRQRDKSCHVFLWVILAVILLPASLASHFVCGIVSDSVEGESAIGRTIHLSYSTSLNKNVSCTVGEEDHTYCCDAELIPGTTWSAGKIVTSSLVPEGDGYFANSVNTTTTISAYDVAASMNLTYSLLVSSPFATTYAVNFTLLQINTSNGFTTLSYQLDSNELVSLCSSCTYAAENITDFAEGEHTLRVYASSGILSLSKNITFAINAVDDPPSFASYFPTSFQQELIIDEDQNFRITLEDPDTVSLTTVWYLNGTPVLANALNYTYTPDEIGIYNLTILATDGNSIIYISWNISVITSETASASAQSKSRSSGNSNETESVSPSSYFPSELVKNEESTNNVGEVIDNQTGTFAEDGNDLIDSGVHAEEQAPIGQNKNVPQFQFPQLLFSYQFVLYVVISVIFMVVLLFTFSTYYLCKSKLGSYQSLTSHLQNRKTLFDKDLSVIPIVSQSSMGDDTQRKSTENSLQTVVDNQEINVKTSETILQETGSTVHQTSRMSEAYQSPPKSVQEQHNLLHVLEEKISVLAQIITEGKKEKNTIHQELELLCHEREVLLKHLHDQKKLVETLFKKQQNLKSLLGNEEH